MLDVRFIYENQDVVRQALAKRSSSIDIAPIVANYELRRQLTTDVEGLKAERNEASKSIGKLKRAGEDTTEAQAKVRELGDRIKGLDAQLSEVEGELRDTLLTIPNLLHSSVPEGKDESFNVEVRRVGEVPTFDFEVKDHVDLGTDLGLLDLERAAKLSGARFSVLRGAGARLERALAAFMLDEHRARGYEEFMPPLLVSRETLTTTGQLPKFEEDLFRTEFGDRELFLIPTAEVPLTAYHAQEILPEQSLPLYYTAFTPCFRSEAGSYGRDVRGLIRQHQFNKVELVKICHPDNSMEELERMTADAENILQKLELPYRVMTLASGDVGFSAHKTYDLEVWLPAQGTYREISSCSNCTNFQARRGGLRFRPDAPKSKPRFAHTLNGSGLAVGRTLIAVLENHQQADGSVLIPPVLRPYMGGQTVIHPEG